MNKSRATKSALAMPGVEIEDNKTLAGAQTLDRGLDVLSAVATGAKTLQEISDTLGLNRSTAHRLAGKLVEHKFLSFQPRYGYSLGQKLLELGYIASQHTSVTRVAHEYLVRLSQSTGDTTHLVTLSNYQALYLDKSPGSRNIDVTTKIGSYLPVRSTGLGKALLLDETEESLSSIYDRERLSVPDYKISKTEWLKRMKTYALAGYAYDLGEVDDFIRCVAAPVRDSSGRIVASISVSSTVNYMDAARMKRLAPEVIQTANDISAELGWADKTLSTDSRTKKRQTPK